MLTRLTFCIAMAVVSMPAVGFVGAAPPTAAHLGLLAAKPKWIVSLAPRPQG